jgi:hypothetical protein
LRWGAADSTRDEGVWRSRRRSRRNVGAKQHSPAHNFVLHKIAMTERRFASAIRCAKVAPSARCAFDPCSSVHK